MSGRLLFGTLCAVALAGHISSYTFLNDDAYISFRYAAHWVDHGEITYNLGERVEGYTNFLWVALLAGARALGADIPQVSLWLGALLSLATLALVGLSQRLTPVAFSTKQRQASTLFALGLLALSPSLACWSSGGLEVALFTFLLTLSVALSVQAWERGTWRCGVGAGSAYALLALTRPEGVLLFGVAGLYRLGMLLSGRVRSQTVQRGWGAADWGGVLGFMGIYLPYFLWRYHYYGYVFPNTYYAKTGATGFWEPGFRYVGAWVSTQPWVLLGLGSLWIRGRLAASDTASIHSEEVSSPSPDLWRSLRGLTLLSSVVLIIHVARVGGDFMELHRFLVPLLPLLALPCSVTLVSWCTSRSLTRDIKYGALAACLLLQLSRAEMSYRYANRIGSAQGVDSIGWLRKYAAKWAEVGRFINKTTAPQSTLATTAAGALPYYAERYTLDLLGLNDAWIAHNVPARGHRPGHTKAAPFNYPLRRKVTHLIYHPTTAPYRPRAHPRYQRALRPWGYQWKTYRIPASEGMWWGVWVHQDAPPLRPLSPSTMTQ